MNSKWVEESSPIDPVLRNECNEIKLNEETWGTLLEKIKGLHLLDIGLH